jgi:S-adenosylmethionine:tRNA ribosyltransferase-isomerase
MPTVVAALANSMPSLKLEDFNYEFPKQIIATSPATPRDTARLLVYNRSSKELQDRIFRDLPTLLPKNSVLVLNQTKVIPARLVFKKATGGKVSGLFLRTQRNTCIFLLEKLVPIGSQVYIDKKRYFTVKKKAGSEYSLVPNFKLTNINVFLAKYGTTPLPPYMRHGQLSESKARKEYQTVFAKTYGSVAAPTASLHFTKPLLQRLKQRGIKIEYITLHVGLGTFAPITTKDVQTKRLHTESYTISQAAAKRLNRYKQSGRMIVAVGTTVVRTLETASNSRGLLTKLSGDTHVFIQPGDRLLVVDGLITNFHVPQSSLLMLVSAFTGRKELLSLYELAIHRHYRLFSFGDAMLIL